MAKRAYTNLLAKNVDASSTLTSLHTVTGHCLRVAYCAEQICERLKLSLQRTFALDEDAFNALSKRVQIAALLHDLGKANESFQAQLQHNAKDKHIFHHEMVSVALLFAHSTLSKWLARGLSTDELLYIAMVIGGHHLRMQDLECRPRRFGDAFVYTGHDELLPLWEKLAELVGYSQPPAPSDLDACQDALERALLRYRRKAAPDKFTTDELIKVSLGKALLVAADTVGSSHTEDELVLGEWLELNLEPTLTADALQEVIDARLSGHKPFPFQQEVADSQSQVTLVSAGCGNGKTLAAYLWARQKLNGQRLVFCYPTTGTTTAGFQDYLLAQLDLERALMHGRAGADVTEMIATPIEAGDGTDVWLSNLAIWAPDVLDLWRRDVIACTVDSLLGLLAYWRRSMALMPVWANALFVFDEIHSYDAKLFGTLLDFLRVVKAPTLLMTASLSNVRLAALEEELETTLLPIKGNPEIERAKRYELTLEDDLSVPDVANLVLSALARGEKVLYVANTIGRARAAFDELSETIQDHGMNASVLLYHSRFKYEDRVKRQAEVIASFARDEPGLVIATQVCEMSLDLSADLLITELAPLPSLIQRLGRLNRRDKIPASSAPCVIIEPENELPYDEDELDACRDLLAKEGLLGKPISQEDLSAALELLEEASLEYHPTPFSAEAADTISGTIRDASYTITLVRGEDLTALSSKKRRDITQIELSMPVRECVQRGLEKWRRIYGIPITPTGKIDYSVERGATWAS